MGILCTWSRRFRLDYDDHDASVGDDDGNDDHDGMDSRVDAADGHGGGAGGDYDIDEDVGCVAAASVSNKTSEMQPNTQNTKPKCWGGTCPHIALNATRGGSYQGLVLWVVIWKGCTVNIGALIITYTMSCWGS